MNLVTKLRKNKEAVYRHITLPIQLGDEEETLTFRVRALSVAELLKHVKGLPRLFGNIEGIPEAEELDKDNLGDFADFLTERYDVFEDLVCLAVELQDGEAYIPFVKEDLQETDITPGMLGISVVSQLATEVISNFRTAIR